MNPTNTVYPSPHPAPGNSSETFLNSVLDRVWSDKQSFYNNFMFEFPCIITLYYIKNQQDATLAVLFISNGKITLHVSDAFCVHHQEY